MRTRLVCVFCLSLLAGAGAAQPYFKEINPDGSVTYTDEPSGAGVSVERVDVPGHDDTGIADQGRQRVQEMEAANKQLTEEREARRKAAAERAERLSQAERELDTAERALATARESKKHATPERLRSLQEKVALARKQLRQVQAGAE